VKRNGTDMEIIGEVSKEEAFKGVARVEASRLALYAWKNVASPHVIVG